MQIDKGYEYVLELLQCVLADKKPSPLPDGVTFEEIYAKAEFHHVVNTVFYAIEKSDTKPQGEILRKFSEARDKFIVRDMLQLHELSRLEKKLCDEKIRYVKLKGSVMKPLYPQSDMRYMTDIDIIVDAQSLPLVNSAMKALGYDVREYGTGNHDEYEKKPVMSVEVHRALFADFTFYGKDFCSLFENIFEVCQSSSEYTYTLDNTHFLMHLITHTAKHYLAGGIGFRAFMDIWLYYNKYKDSINMEYIYSSLKKTEQYELCCDILDLSFMWFGDKEYDSRLDEMVKYIFSGGAFGLLQRGVENEIKATSKKKYLLSQIIPSYKALSSHYKVVRKIPILYPVFVIWRLISKPFTNFGVVKEKVKTVLKK